MGNCIRKNAGGWDTYMRRRSWRRDGKRLKFQHKLLIDRIFKPSTAV
jgi:hypothetical protein